MRSVCVSMISDPFSASACFPRPSWRATDWYLTTKSPSATDSESTQRRIEQPMRIGGPHLEPLSAANCAQGQPASRTLRSIGSAELEIATALNVSAVSLLYGATLMSACHPAGATRSELVRRKQLASLLRPSAIAAMRNVGVVDPCGGGGEWEDRSRRTRRVAPKL
jgi:hypothetical protein